jgi:hypothetical protein
MKAKFASYSCIFELKIDHRAIGVIGDGAGPAVGRVN